ncbi:hypothetical protein V6N11_058480 [Hibiscus sabdariffa]|uniref:Ribosomal protein L10 n=1 Tax=Hibiscus sabdariffa TaxID=183260 RepID=A0ABR2U4N6_9ROSI
MPFGTSLLQKESLYRVSGEERSPEILILFHSSGSTNNQWRKLKNPWFPGRTPFRPSCCGTGKKKWFFAQLAHNAGPTCIFYLAEEASTKGGGCGGGRKTLSEIERFDLFFIKNEEGQGWPTVRVI